MNWLFFSSSVPELACTAYPVMLVPVFIVIPSTFADVPELDTTVSKEQLPETPTVLRVRVP